MYKEKYPLLLAVNYFLLALVFLLNFSPLIGLNNSLNSILTSLIAFAFMILHGYMAWGTRNIIAFIVITWILSFFAEAIGVGTGVIFGQYYYTDHLGPKLLGVPLLIQVSYVTMGYVSLMMARLILGIKEITNNVSLVYSTFIGTLLMVSWDLCLDPYESTVFADWVWPQGGPYFGIGIQNFIGWFVTVFIFMFIYQQFAFYYREQFLSSSRSFWSQPLIYYAIMMINVLSVPLVGGVKGFASPENYRGSLDDLIYSLVLITFFVMGTPCFIALGRLLLVDNNPVEKHNKEKT